MHWSILTAAVALGISFIQLGAMSVWVSVLLLVLKAVLLAVIIVLIAGVSVVLWRRYR